MSFKVFLCVYRDALHFNKICFESFCSYSFWGNLGPLFLKHLNSQNETTFAPGPFGEYRTPGTSLRNLVLDGIIWVPDKIRYDQSTWESRKKLPSLQKPIRAPTLLNDVPLHQILSATHTKIIEIQYLVHRSSESEWMWFTRSSHLSCHHVWVSQRGNSFNSFLLTWTLSQKKATLRIRLMKISWSSNRLCLGFGLWKA